MEIVMKGPTGVTKKVKLGHSYTTMLFGFWPAALRGDFKWASIMFVTYMLIISLYFPMAAVSNIMWGLYYNKFYVEDLIKKGYKPVTDDGEVALNHYLS